MSWPAFALAAFATVLVLNKLAAALVSEAATSGDDAQGDLIALPHDYSPHGGGPLAGEAGHRHG